MRAFRRRVRRCADDARAGDADDAAMQRWEYLIVPLEEAGKVNKKDAGLSPARLNDLGAQGWEAIGLTLKRGDLVAWPVVLLKRPRDQEAGPIQPYVLPRGGPAWRG